MQSSTRTCRARCPPELRKLLRLGPWRPERTSPPQPLIALSLTYHAGQERVNTPPAADARVRASLAFVPVRQIV
jgi:hypothetical protein